MSTMKAAGLDTTFSNALCNKNIGGAYGGADFNPYDKSETEIQVTCFVVLHCQLCCIVLSTVLYCMYSCCPFTSLFSLVPFLFLFFILLLSFRFFRSCLLTLHLISSHQIPSHLIAYLSLLTFLPLLLFSHSFLEVLSVVHDRAVQVHRTRYRFTRARRRC